MNQICSKIPRLLIDNGYCIENSDFQISVISEVYGSQNRWEVLYISHEENRLELERIIANDSSTFSNAIKHDSPIFYLNKLIAQSKGAYIFYDGEDTQNPGSIYSANISNKFNGKDFNRAVFSVATINRPFYDDSSSVADCSQGNNPRKEKELKAIFKAIQELIQYALIHYYIIHAIGLTTFGDS